MKDIKVEPAEDQKMPVDHPLNCRCRECRE
jgi:hypothetical protein